ncbi:hypothetical protein EYA84_06435 [Verrucosispora sp. SN26_14.1]|uniref:hypothetical protein n=1 Tax=Verrucosispora sp. SN26_14.1 TaxID=2527879 RepID=UPI001033AB30|nr:hypothetical protein [Verrucosispora sp. SN26_14.1]TBL40894.1 hypothetical protein EYA84_06435 [Verrucosispora sp. SN26_14.1]
MLKHLARYLAVIALAVGGTTVATASPAFAIGGCDQSNATVGACFDHPNGNSNARADFYFNRTPDSSYYSYSVWIEINGTRHQKVNKARLTSSGRHCCWYQPVSSLPPSWKTGRTIVTIYTSTGAAHTTSTSPSYSFYV